MKLIEPSVNIIEESNPLKQIERIGRICYKSEDKITEDSAPKFVDMLVNRKHYAMLEHGVVHFVYERYWGTDEVDIAEQYLCGIPGVVVTRVLEETWLITISMSHVYNTQYQRPWLMKMMARMVQEGTKEMGSDNWRIVQVTLPEFKQLLNRDEMYQIVYSKHAHISAHFVCDRGVSHELVRHRCAAAQESTRYCNYGSDKFGNEITFIKPSTIESWSEEDAVDFCSLLEHSEQVYLNMISRGRKPQEARAILPNALKTEVVLTMSRQRWEHFLDLRSRGTTGAPHPDMKVLADQLANLIEMYDATHC